MNSADWLFVLSVVLIPILLVSMGYDTIYNFYTYSVPLNRLQLIYEYDTSDFEQVRDREGSDCFTTPSHNHFCYTKPRMHGSGGVSFVAGPSGVSGEMHFDPVDGRAFPFTIKSMTKVNEDEAVITLSDKGYRIGNEETTHYAIAEKFEFSKTIRKFDTFISHCGNYEGTSATIVQYMGTAKINQTEYFVTWHTSAQSESGISCDYPQVIKYSFGHHFGGL